MKKENEKEFYKAEELAEKDIQNIVKFFEKHIEIDYTKLEEKFANL